MPDAATTTALPTTADPTLGPAADRAADPAATRAPAQPCFGGMLSLLRKLIEYGQDLARSVQQRATAGTLFTIALQFGTRDMALILSRITRGLRLGQALEQRLIHRPLRPDAAPASLRAPVDRSKRSPRRVAARPALPDVPTAEEIAAALRHRPAAAVIADICRDLGIVPSHPLWREVMAVLPENGSILGLLFRDVVKRVFNWRTAPSDDGGVDGWPMPGSKPVAAYGTGPP